MLLVAPLLIAARRECLDRLRERPLHAAAFVGAQLVVAATFALVGDPVLAPALRSPIIVVSLVLVVVGAMRFGLFASAVTTLAMSTLASLSFAFDRGLMAGLPELGGLVLLWSYVGAMTGFELIVTALLAEQTRRRRSGSGPSGATRRC